MDVVKLFSDTGEHVGSVLADLKAIIQWGDRLFAKQPNMQYVETVAYVATEVVPEPAHVPEPPPPPPPVPLVDPGSVKPESEPESEPEEPEHTKSKAELRAEAKAAANG